MWAQAVRERLSDYGYRSTRTRDAVVGYLGDQGYLVPVDQISDAVSVDPVTVYRVLEVLEELGVVIKVQSHPSYVVVSQSLRDTPFHAIFIDEDAHKVLIHPYTPERESITPRRAVIEVRGKLNHNEPEYVPDKKITIHDDVSEEAGLHEGVDGASIVRQPETSANNKSIDSPADSKTSRDSLDNEEDSRLDPHHIDRLQRF